MKKRIVKKIAVQFLQGRKSFPAHWEECNTHNDGRPGVDQLWVTPPKKIEREICHQALDRGLWWQGCHWDHPCIIETDTSRLDAWEEMNPGR